MRDLAIQYIKPVLRGKDFMLVIENLTRCEVTETSTYIYSYRMTKGIIRLPFGENGMEVQSYGIEVERQDIINGVTSNIERDSLKSISPYRHKVHNLLKMLYDNEVSPIHFIDVVGEYVDEYILDFDKEYTDIATN